MIVSIMWNKVFRIGYSIAGVDLAWLKVGQMPLLTRSSPLYIYCKFFNIYIK